MTNMVLGVNNNASTHVDINYKTKSFYLMTSLSIPLNGDMTYWQIIILMEQIFLPLGKGSRVQNNNVKFLGNFL